MVVGIYLSFCVADSDVLNLRPYRGKAAFRDTHFMAGSHAIEIYPKDLTAKLSLFTPLFINKFANHRSFT